MFHFKKHLLFLALVFCFLMTGCQKTTSVSSEDTIILNEVAHSIFYAPMYVAFEENYFEKEGIKVDLVTGFGADKSMTALLTDEADIAFLGSEASIYTYVQGANDYAVNFAQLTQRAGNFLVAREPIENFDWNMLRGSYVLGGRKGGMPEMVFEYILKTNGIDPDTDLTIDKSIDFGSTAAAFAGANENDPNYPYFTVEFEPHATSLETQNKGYVVASLGVDSGYVPYTAFCAKKSYMESHSEQLQKFTNAIQRGLNFVNSHSASEIATVIQPQFKETDLQTITTIVDRYLQQDTWKTDVVFEETSFKLLENILIDAGELEDFVSYTDLVDNTYAKEAQALQ